MIDVSEIQYHRIVNDVKYLGGIGAFRIFRFQGNLKVGGEHLLIFGRAESLHYRCSSLGVGTGGRNDKHAMGRAAGGSIVFLFLIEFGIGEDAIGALHSVITACDNVINFSGNHERAIADKHFGEALVMRLIGKARIGCAKEVGALGVIFQLGDLRASCVIVIGTEGKGAGAVLSFAVQLYSDARWTASRVPWMEWQTPLSVH